MIACWLYSQDGRALWCVWVIAPMPPFVTYRGMLFTWSGRRYEEVMATIQAATAPPFVPTSEVPEADRPPKDE